MPRTLRITLLATGLLVLCAAVGSLLADESDGMLAVVAVALRSGEVFFGVFAAGGALAVLLGLFHRAPRSPAAPL